MNPAYLASPLRRVAAAAIDFAVFLLLALFAAAVTQVRLGLLDMGTAAVVVFVLYHGGFLYYWSGETPGRRVLSIRVVRTRAAIGLTLLQCAARPLLKGTWLLSFVPLEYASGASWISFLPLFVDLVLMTALPSRQTVADLLCRTVVVNLPPPQPHRAPAGPMYSATDAEFGVPARRP